MGKGEGTWPQGGHVPSQIPILKIFSLNSAEFVTLNRIFSMFIGFLGASPLDPIEGSDRVWTALGTDGTPFVPIGNKFQVTLLCGIDVFWRLLAPCHCRSSCYAGNWTSNVSVGTSNVHPLRQSPTPGSYTPCDQDQPANDSSPVDPNVIYRCSYRPNSRYVVVQFIATTAATLCEVEVYARRGITRLHYRRLEYK